MAAGLSATMEDYLEAIYRLQHSNRVVRVKDIAESLEVKMPSVSAALAALQEEGLVSHEKYGHVELTERGRELAENVHRRHITLVDFLHRILQLEDEEAEEEACKLEHDLSAKTLHRLIGLMEFVEHCPRSGGDWLTHLQGRWEDRGCDHNCRRCVEQIETPSRSPFGWHGGRGHGATLDQQRPGFRGRIVRVRGRGPVRRRLMEMGVTAGTEVEFERIAPLGDPMEVKIRGYHLSLRRSEAANIEVEAEEAAEEPAMETPSSGGAADE